jgi:hypothetical protein
LQIIVGFDWKSLPAGALVVDVGGGIGSSTMRLAKAYPNIKFIVQDLAKVLNDGIDVRYFAYCSRFALPHVTYAVLQP